MPSNSIESFWIDDGGDPNPVLEAQMKLFGENTPISLFHEGQRLGPPSLRPTYFAFFHETSPAVQQASHDPRFPWPANRNPQKKPHVAVDQTGHPRHPTTSAPLDYLPSPLNHFCYSNKLFPLLVPPIPSFRRNFHVPEAT